MMQVYVEDRLVGHLNLPVSHGPTCALEILSAEDLWFDPYEAGPLTKAVSRRVELPVRQRGVTVVTDHYALASDPASAELRLAHARTQLHIPENAKMRELERPGGFEKEHVFIWRAIQISLDVYEESVFDHPAFEPV